VKTQLRERVFVAETMDKWKKVARRLILPHYAAVEKTSTVKQFGVLITNDATEVDNWLEKHVYSSSAAAAAAEDLGGQAVGFDVEWQADQVPYRGRYQKTDLIQIATPQEVLLYQCRHIHTPSVMPRNLPAQTFPDSMLDLGV
jgi:hypothetical protein